jgi:hypothetical protein
MCERNRPHRTGRSDMSTTTDTIRVWHIGYLQEMCGSETTEAE